VPLRQLLAEAGLRHVNFFSLDVEGAELTVLKVCAELINSILSNLIRC